MGAVAASARMARANSADSVGATATPDGEGEAGSGGKKGRKKRHHKKRGDGSVDGSADGSGPADSASSVHAMSPSPQSSPSSLLSPFSPSSLALAFSPVSPLSPLSPGLSATLDKLRSPLSRVRIDELQIAAQLMAEDGMQRLAEASAAAAQAALDIARDQFREHIQEAFVALSKVYFGHAANTATYLVFAPKRTSIDLVFFPPTRRTPPTTCASTSRSSCSATTAPSLPSRTWCTR
jgi:hypothetical protein